MSEATRKRAADGQVRHPTDEAGAVAHQKLSWGGTMDHVRPEHPALQGRPRMA